MNKKYFLLGFILIVGVFLILHFGFNIFHARPAKIGNRENNIAPIKEGYQNSREVIKVKVNKILEDADLWRQESIQANAREKGRITIDFNKRGALASSEHMIAHINRVNDYTKSANEYIKKLNGEIEDLLLSAGEGKFETANWLKEEYGKYSKFTESVKTTENNIKKQSSEFCLRFSDKAAFDKVLTEHPYSDSAY
jgi:hypothetical protein